MGGRKSATPIDTEGRKRGVKMSELNDTDKGLYGVQIIIRGADDESYHGSWSCTLFEGTRRAAFDLGGRIEALIPEILEMPASKFDVDFDDHKKGVDDETVRGE